MDPPVAVLHMSVPCLGSAGKISDNQPVEKPTK
jgi:hypothetical protein